MTETHEHGSIEVEHHGDVAVVSLIGEHDLITAEAVRKELAGRAAAGDLVVSLMQTTFLASEILHALLHAHRVLRQRQRGLVLHVATASIVDRILTTSGLRNELVCTGSLDAAVLFASLQSERAE